MSNDVLITPASRKIEFKDSSANVDAKIETDASGNLVITNAGGDISIGDTTSDIFVGDGTNNVDIVFEQDGEIRGTSGVTVTLGASGSNVRMATDLNLNSNDITNVNDLTVAGNLTVSGTTTTVNSTNTTIGDSLIELNSGLTGANAKDIGLIFERGSTGNNAAFFWDESGTRFRFVTTTDTGSSTTITNNISEGTVQAGSFIGNGSQLSSLNASNLSSGTVSTARLAHPTSGDWWKGGPPLVATDGVMEIGKYIDFHNTDTTTADFDTRLYSSGSNELTINGVGRILTTADEGAGNGLNADQVDGIEGASLLRSDANDTYTGTLSVAGTIQDSGDSRRIHYMYGTTNSQPAFGLGEQGTYGMKMRWDSGSSIEFDGFWNTSVTGARNRDLGDINVNTATWNLPALQIAGSNVATQSYAANASNISSGTINTARLPNPIHLSGANAILKLQETDVTNSPTWWHVADGSNYSIRLNNTGAYPIQILTDSDNDAVTNIELNYTVDLGGNKLQLGSEATSYIQSTQAQGTDVFRFTTEDGYIQIGAENTSWAHFITDRPSFYFNTKVTVAGHVEPYTDSSYNLGANTLRWSNVYADTLHGDGSNITGVTATDSTKLPLAGGTMTGNINLNGNNLNSVNLIQFQNEELTTFTGARQMIVDANDGDSNVPSHGDYAGSYPFGIYFTGDNDASTTTLGSGLVKVWHTGHFKKEHIDYFVGLKDTGVTTTEFDYLDGVTSNIQTQLNGKQASGSYLTGNQTITLSGDVSGSGTTSISVTVADDSHNHVISNVDGLQTALDAKMASSGGTFTGAVTISQSGTPILSLYDSGNAGGGGASGKILFSNTGGNAMGIGYTGDSTADSDMIISTNAAGTYGGYLSLAANGITDSSADIILEPKGSVRIAGSGDLRMGTTQVITSAGNWVGGGNVSEFTNDSGYLTSSALSGYATESYVTTQVNNLVDSAPGALNTLNELAAAINDDASFSTTITNSIATKLPLAGGTMTGDINMNANDVLGASKITLNMNPVGTSYGGTSSATPANMISQVVGSNDGWRLYGEGASNDVQMIFEIIDDLETGDTWIFRNKKTYSDYSTRNEFIITGEGTFKSRGNGYVNTSQRVFADDYHPNADKWTTARTLSLTGAVTGSVSWDGSGNASIATTATSDPTLTLSGDASGSATFTNLGNATLSVAITDDSHFHHRLDSTDDRDMKPSTSGIAGSVQALKPFFSSYGGMTGSANTTYVDVLAFDTYSDSSGGGPSAITFKKGNAAGNPEMHIWHAGWNATTWSTGQRVFADNYHPNADTLTTARTIAGTSFDGSANIDISYDNLTNKPTIPTNNNQLTNGANYITSSSNISGTAAGLSGTPNITVGTIGATSFQASGSDTTPAGTSFANTVKGVSDSRTMYFDGNGTGVSTWYGVGNNPFAAIDCTDGVMDFWVNPSNGSWYNIFNTDTNGITQTYGSRIMIDSSSDAYYVADGSTDAWKYLRLSTNGTANWDIATKNNDLGGSLQFRPSGNDSNRTYMDLSGNWFIQGGIDLSISETDTNDIDMPRGGYITFYGDNSTHHSIGSRDQAGNQADDLTISTYGALYIDLDSNNNNTSGADFVIGRHGSTSQNLFKVDGESAHATLGYDGKTPNFKLIYDDNHANGDRWDTVIELGRLQDRHSGNSQYPTYQTANGYGLYMQGNSDGCFFGMEEYNTTPNFRPVIAWGDDTSDSPFFIRYNNTAEFAFTYNGVFHADDDIIAFSTTTSDARYKDNVSTIENALDKVQKLRGVEFDWNATSRKGEHDIGFIAQEIEQVIPEVVSEQEMLVGDFEGKDEKAKTVAYGQVTALLVEAIKEQQETINKLIDRIDSLEKGE